ncbi:response regulator [Agrobacterium pusense]|uniref:response regulator n=1 Tax=Agrobacterium pusense TaxID=648995 RepID=UPI003FD3D0FD
MIVDAVCPGSSLRAGGISNPGRRLPCSAVHGLIGIVDDDRRVLNGLQQLLESVGTTFYRFRASGLLNSDHLNNITCVITDIGMPEANGFELRDILNREHPTLPVILIAGRYELIENLPPENGLKILRKPFDFGSAFCDS